jgi:hypothetical protein
MLASSAAISSVASAAVPLGITHQGRLYAADNQPVNRTLAVKFSFYDSPEAEMPVWTEVHLVDFEDGYFSVRLGEMVPLDPSMLDSVRFLGVTVGDDDELSPRAEVGSVPFALACGDARGDIHPTSVSVAGVTVIDDLGHWVGDSGGLVGPAGEAGPMGPEGPAGKDGEPGVDGAVGPTGPQGPAGAVGPMGPQGPAGAVGPMGPQGPTGAVGPMGATGPQGPAGAVGAVGPMGATGPQGPAGAVGAVGPMGAMGPQGPAGAVGAVGPMGAMGPQGPAGAVGAVGPMGAMGPQGPAGADGAMGPMGPMGLQGPPGADGVAGPMGPQGTAGLAGAVGPTGPEGPAGPSGQVYIQTLASVVTADIAENSPSWVFVGTPQQVTLEAGDTVSGFAQAALGSSWADAHWPMGPTFFYDLCYAIDGDPPVAFSAPISPQGDLDVRPLSWSAAGTVVLGAGTYQVGFCVMNASFQRINLYSSVTGWFQVTQL